MYLCCAQSMDLRNPWIVPRNVSIDTLRNKVWICCAFHGLSRCYAQSTLISRRQTSRLCLLYKIIHNLVDVTLPNYITPATRFTRGHDQKFILPQPRIDAYKFNFSQIQLDYGTAYPLKQYMHTQSTVL